MKELLRGVSGPAQCASLRLVFNCGLRRIAKADRHTIEGVHQADRDREVDQLFSPKTARAAWYASSGTPVWATRVTVSAQARAARSVSLKRLPPSSQA